MKLETSIKNAMRVAERIKQCNGLIGTPHASHEALRISRAWVFGSTAKGKLNPGDTDILLECKKVGRFNFANATRMPRHLDRSGVRYRLDAIRAGYGYLRTGLKMVRFHDIKIDGQIGDVENTKIMIYPRMDLPKFFR
jgi:predicted nucleotidyltransferase